MSVESIIYNVLSTTTAITNIVGNKIFPSIPQDPSFPFLIYTRTDTENYPTLDYTTDTFERAEITLSLWIQNMDDAVNLASLIKAALIGYRGGLCQGVFLVRQQSAPQTDLDPLICHIILTFNVYAS